MFTHLFREYLDQKTASEQIGKTIKDRDGKTWFCVGHNDLGVLYFAKSMKPKAKWYCDNDLARKLVPTYGPKPASTASP